MKGLQALTAILAVVLATATAAQDARPDQDTALSWLFGDCLDYVLISAPPFTDEATTPFPPGVLKSDDGSVKGLMLRNGGVASTWGIRDGRTFCTIFALDMDAGLKVDAAPFIADVNTQAADLGLIRILARQDGGGLSYWWAETPEVTEQELEISVDLSALPDEEDGKPGQSAIVVMGVFGPVTTLLN